MTVKLRPYDHKRDFDRVRDFLAQTYDAFPGPFNWGIERWNYARYFVAPMLGAVGNDPTNTEGERKSIHVWQDLTRIWEDEDGNIVGAVCIEHPSTDHSGFGEIFVQRHPDHVNLLDPMVAFCEGHYVHPERKRVYAWVYEDDEALTAVMTKRGYERLDEPVVHHLEYAFGDLGQLKLPDGFRLISMAEENDIEKRREIFGRGFNHEEPEDWPSAYTYRELQKAPDYHLENDLVIIAPDGTYAACCIVWYDEVNHVGYLEPLATHPKYRRLGLAREIQFEGMRRLQNLGATRLPMTGGFEPFYRAVGFRELRRQYAWIKRF